MNELMNECMIIGNEWIKYCNTPERMDECIWMDGFNEWVNHWLNEGMNGLTIIWMNECAWQVRRAVSHT